jgi:tRNA/tmRNA/rRNA uracil-C5-methylase (TrmA/RlmC/RlmD family)
MSMEQSLAQKDGYLARVLGAWSQCLEPVIGPPPGERLGYRDRVTLTARWSDASGWLFGLVRRDELLPIHHCPVHSRRVNALVELLARSLPAGSSYPLAYLHVAGAQATLIVKARAADPALPGALGAEFERIGIEGIWQHRHAAAGRRLFARSGWDLVWGRPRSVDGQGFHYGPTTFRQLLPRLHEGAMTAAEAHLAPGPAAPVMDLYSGAGATLRRWLDAGAATVGVELSGEAIELAGRNAPGAELLRGTCVQRLPQLGAWWERQSGQPVVYVNPPRSGLEPPLLEALCDGFRPARLAYLSCSAGTLARDLRGLEQSGLQVTRILPFDFFPQTHHVEALALLERRG